MKAVMISIQPKWCELIASGRKTIEVRKTAPKLERPFKCYIYETKDKKYEDIGIMGYRKDGTRFNFLNHIGKVIGEFVCDRIDKIKPIYEFYKELGYDLNDTQIKETCLTREELKEYGTRKVLYGWHITDLVIYDKPKELSEFYQKVEGNIKWDYDYCVGCPNHETPISQYPCNECDGNRKYLSRPPQSWCYVEEE